LGARRAARASFATGENGRWEQAAFWCRGGVLPAQPWEVVVKGRVQEESNTQICTKFCKSIVVALASASTPCTLDEL
jgi:hypothetical protein